VELSISKPKEKLGRNYCNT